MTDLTASFNGENQEALQKSKEESTLSRKVLEAQQANKWPGLSAEVEEICSELGMPDLNIHDMPGKEIKNAVLDHHDRKIKEDVSNSKKMEQHENDNFSKIQEYFEGKSLYDCRLAFRIRCELVKDIKGNFKDKHRRKGGEDALKCEDCTGDTLQTQSHCLVCPRWGEIRNGLELDRIGDLVTFFKRMLAERLGEKTGS